MKASTSSSRGAPDPSYLLYVYCIVEAGTEAHRLLRERQVPGIEVGEPLFPVQEGGLVAAVSRVPATSFQEEPLNALLSALPSVAPIALRHHQAIGALTPAAPALVPMTLGAVYRTPERVSQLLRDRSEELGKLLGELRGKQEWGIKVLEDRARLLEATKAESGELRRLNAEAAAQTPGRAYLLRKQRERLVAAEADRIVRETVAAVLRDLVAVTAAIRVDQLPAVQQESPRLVLKAALLVDSGGAAALLAALNELQHIHGPRGFSLELDGPWATYSFVGNQGAGVGEQRVSV